MSFRLIVGTILSAGVVFLATWPGGLRLGDRDRAGKDEAAQASTQQTWLMIGTVESDPSREANWLSVLSWEQEKGEGFVLYVPRSVVVEIPGFGGGPDMLGKALALGQETTLVSALSNLLGINFEHFVRISDQGVEALFEKLGGVTIEVENRLTQKDAEGLARVVFAEGRQHLDGKRVAEFLTYLDEGGDEISRAVRHTLVWQALFEEFREKGADEFARLLTESKDLFVTDAQGDALSSFFARFVSAPAEDVQFETLPVEAQAIQSGSQLYGPNSEAIDSMVEKYLAGSRPPGGSRSRRRVQILNGNGVPGIGEEISGRLLPKGFQVVLDDNAGSFDYETTQIVIYSESKQAQSMAEEIREALGVGEIRISRQRQSIVDVTIVVGKDYLKQR